jgi:hypothetical protein
MLYDMARTFSLTRHRRFFYAGFDSASVSDAVSIFVSHADCVSVRRRPQFAVLRLPGSQRFDHCSQCLCSQFSSGLAIIAIVLAIPAMVQRVLNPSLTAGFWPVGNLILSFTDFSPGV